MQYVLVFWFLSGLGGFDNTVQIPMQDLSHCQSALYQLKQNKDYRIDGLCIFTRGK